jgi:2-hydroxy-3-keto-5-methylthiopentenyl-1-phosphate phosphatase
MRNWLFISDFDGTLTHKDFYEIMMDKYLSQKGRELEARWKRGELTVFQFLSAVFASVDRSQADIDEDIRYIPIDEYATEFIQRVKSSGGDFLILSAGTRYYIERLMTHLRIEGTMLISNPGVYRERGIQMTADIESPYYSPVYGIDKAKVVADFKQRYDKVYFAGDSEPDLRAAIEADMAFAKPGLQKLLAKSDHAFVPINCVREIADYLDDQGMLS